MDYPENTQLIEKAKSFFPNMPGEVFDNWLLPIVRDHNSWPYRDFSSPHPSEQWRRYFGLFTIMDIHKCRWTVVNLTFDMGCLDPISNGVVEILIENNVHHFDATEMFNVHNSKSRFDGLVAFIQGTGRVPAPIIGINTGSGLRVLDGNHRLAALTHLKLRGMGHCRTWVGAPPI